MVLPVRSFPHLLLYAAAEHLILCWTAIHSLLYSKPLSIFPAVRPSHTSRLHPLIADLPAHTLQHPRLSRLRNSCPGRAPLRLLLQADYSLPLHTRSRLGRKSTWDWQPSCLFSCFLLRPDLHYTHCSLNLHYRFVHRHSCRSCHLQYL